MSRSIRCHGILSPLVALGVSCALASAATAGRESAVPWLDLVRESELLVTGEIESVHRPGLRVERSALRVEEVWIGQAPARIALRLRGPRAELRAAGLERLAMPVVGLGGSWEHVRPAGVLVPGARVLAFLSSSRTRGRRLAPVGGVAGMLPLTAGSEAADRRLVSILLAAGDRLDVAMALPALRREGEAPSQALLASVLAELGRRVGPADRGALIGLVCDAGDYWPAVQPDAIRWAGRAQAAEARPCLERALTSASEPWIREGATRAVAELDE